MPLNLAREYVILIIQAGQGKERRGDKMSRSEFKQQVKSELDLHFKEIIPNFINRDNRDLKSKMELAYNLINFIGEC